MKKKILFMMPALPGGGAEKVLIDILGHFDYHLFDVTLFLEYREGVYLKEVPEEVRIVSLHPQNTIWFERLHRVLRMTHCYAQYHSLVYKRQFLKLLEGERFDTVISFMEGAAVKFHSYIADQTIRNISWVHIDLKQKHWSLAFFRDSRQECEAYHKMDQVVFVSEDAKNRFLEMYPVLSDRSKVIYNLINRNAIRHLAETMQVKKRKFTICMVGRLNQQKRYDRALQAAKRLKDNGYDFELWIIGEGELEQSLKELSHKLDINGYVHFLGFKKPPYPYMRIADIYLNTSEAEGFPLVNCEALCLGLPIVSTATAGPRELLDNSQYGLLVDENVEAIYQGVKKLMDDDTLRIHYHKKALQRSGMFDVEETMNLIYNIICQSKYL